MNAPSHEPPHPLPRWAWTLPLLAVVPLLLVLGDELQEIDPAQYAEVGRRIALTGDFVMLHDAWGDFLNKPPMTMWLIALAIRALGATSAAARLPSLLAGLLTVACVFRLGERLWDRRTGWAAAALYAASPALLLSVADPKIDALVTAFIALAVLCAVEGRTRPWALWLAWVFAGCGLLTKGPIGLVIPGLAVLPEALRRRWDGQGGAADVWWRRPFALKPLRGLLLAAAVAAPWFWAMRAQWGNYGPQFILWEQTFGRVFHQSTYNDDTTPLFFVHTSAWAFLPYSPLLAVALVRSARAAWRARALPPDVRRVALWWLVLPFAAISVASAKLPQYAFWLAPPAALLCARLLGELGEAGLLRTRAAFWALAGVGAAAVAFGLWALFPAPAPLAALFLALALLVPGGTFALTRRWPSLPRTVALGAVCLLGFTLFFAGWFHPSLLRYQPDDELGALARAEDPGGEVLPFLDVGSGNAIAYYARRDARTVGVEAVATLVREGKTRAAVVSPASLPKLDAAALRYRVVRTLPTYATSIPRPAFLRAATRPSAVAEVAFVLFTVDSPPPR